MSGIPAPGLLERSALEMPGDFPSESFERIHALLRSRKHEPAHKHFGTAWNAVAYRFLAMCSDGSDFERSIALVDQVGQRYWQERQLFGFFSNGFSTFESFFYGMYAIGALVRPGDFPFATESDFKKVTSVKTSRAYAAAFSGDPIVDVLRQALDDDAYRQLREIRNVLSHRTAPARTMYVGSDDLGQSVPARWQIEDIVLDAQMATIRRAHVARILGGLMDAAAVFCKAHNV